MLLHGWPYDVRAYDEVTPKLVESGARVIVPSLRGFGGTRFIAPEAPRSGQQGAIGADLVTLMNVLKLDRPVLAGYDWGGRAACIVAALHPDRVRGLVSGDGYNIQDITASAQPAAPENEHRKWYQYYFHGARGRAGLAADRRAFCRLLWKLWSPSWRFDEATFERTAVAFDNPDFVEVTIHSYRHRYGLVPGDPRFDEIEDRLREQPAIDVPAISLDGDDDGVMNAGGTADHARHFTKQHEYRRIPGCGHNIPQEKPDEFADAVLTVERWTRDAP